MIISQKEPKPRAQQQWSWTYDDVLDAVDLLLVYIGYRDKLVRLGGTYDYRYGTVRARRCMHPWAMKAAGCIIHFAIRWNSQQPHWVIPPGQDTRNRLLIFGIDPDTITIREAERFKVVWYCLNEYKKPYLSMAKFEKYRKKGLAPELAPKVTVFKRWAGYRKDPAKMITPSGQPAKHQTPPPGSIGAMLQKQTNE